MSDYGSRVMLKASYTEIYPIRDLDLNVVFYNCRKVVTAGFLRSNNAYVDRSNALAFYVTKNVHGLFQHSFTDLNLNEWLEILISAPKHGN